jgi:ribonuclease HII
LKSGTDGSGPRLSCRTSYSSCSIVCQIIFCKHLLNDIGFNVRKTEILRPVIEQESICFAVTHIEPKSDEINILNASMRQCKNAFEIKHPTRVYWMVTVLSFEKRELQIPQA